MTNPINGSTTINILGKEYTFLLDMNALCELESITGSNAISLFERTDTGTASLSDLRALIFCGLKRHHPDITLEEAGDIMGEDTESVLNALTNSFPQPKSSLRGKKKAQPRRK